MAKCSVDVYSAGGIDVVVIFAEERFMAEFFDNGAEDRKAVEFRLRERNHTAA
jgi:hypothetical protein